MSAQVTVSFKNQLAEIERLGQVVTEFAERYQWSPRTLFEVNVSLEELLTNVISYGYEDTQEHEIILRLSLADGEMTAEIEDDGRFATNRARVTRYDELKPMLDERLRRRTRADWIARLAAAGVPCGSVRDLREVFDDAQLAARNMVATLNHPAIGSLRLLGVPVKLSETPASVRTAPPTLGQHTDAVLQTDLGMSASDLATLRASGVI